MTDKLKRLSQNSEASSLTLEQQSNSLASSGQSEGLIESQESSISSGDLLTTKEQSNCLPTVAPQQPQFQKLTPSRVEWEEEKKRKRAKKRKELSLKRLLKDPVPYLPEFKESITLYDNKGLALQKARWLYVKQYLSIGECARAIGANPAQLSKVKKDWDKLRDQLYIKPIQDFVGSKVEDIKDIAGLSLQVIKRNMTMILGSRREVSVENLAQISLILERLDKLGRLEQGLATDNIAFEHATSTENIKKIIKELQAADDFVDYIDVTPKKEEPVQ